MQRRQFFKVGLSSLLLLLGAAGCTLIQVNDKSKHHEHGEEKEKGKEKKEHDKDKEKDDDHGKDDD
jgi:hypothetical protein